MENKTPTSVRVARWSALAAAITALGSIVNTMWTERPWWKEPPIAPIVHTAIQPKSEASGYHTTAPMTFANTAMIKREVASVPTEVKLSLWDRINSISVSTWLIVASSGVGFVSAAVEYFHRRNAKKKVFFDTPTK